MRDGIHPDYHLIRVVMTDGSEFFVRSSYGKEGDTLTLGIDSKSHPVWSGDRYGQASVRGGRISTFNSRFGDFFSK